MLEKNAFTVSFVEEYLRYTLDERVASYENKRLCGLPDLPGFVENRGEPSVLSLLAHKHGLKTFAGAGGNANRVIGNFIRWYAPWGRCGILAGRCRRLLARKGRGVLRRLGV